MVEGYAAQQGPNTSPSPPALGSLQSLSPHSIASAGRSHSAQQGCWRWARASWRDWFLLETLGPGVCGQIRSLFPSSPQLCCGWAVCLWAGAHPRAQPPASADRHGCMNRSRVSVSACRTHCGCAGQFLRVGKACVVVGWCEVAVGSDRHSSRSQGGCLPTLSPVLCEAMTRRARTSAGR